MKQRGRSTLHRESQCATLVRQQPRSQLFTCQVCIDTQHLIRSTVLILSIDRDEHSSYECAIARSDDVEREDRRHAVGNVRKLQCDITRTNSCVDDLNHPMHAQYFASPKNQRTKFTSLLPIVLRLIQKSRSQFLNLEWHSIEHTF